MHTAAEIACEAAVARSVELREDDGNARAGSRDHKEKEVHHRTGDAHRRELQCAAEAAKNESIRSVVELLEDIAHDERCGEAQQML